VTQSVGIPKTNGAFLAAGPRLAEAQCVVPVLRARADWECTYEAGVSGKTGVSVGEVLLRFVREPGKYLIARWNWKSAVLSSLLRALIFFFVNLTAGWRAGLAAMGTELVYRGITSGFYGALTEGFSDAEPAWAGSLAAMLALPLTGHSLELLVHWLRGTQKLVPSITASVIFTAFSTLFNVYAMRRGALIVGKGRGSLVDDLKRMPRLVLEFILVIPRWVTRGGWWTAAVAKPANEA